MINLRITEQQFNELYPDLAGYYNFFDQPPPPGTTPEQFERKYLANKLWRLNNIYTVINKDGEPVVFRMNYAQHKVYAATRQHARVVILKSRQQGISTFWLVSFFDDAVWCPFLSIGLMAQGTDEASTLLERVKLLWDMLDPDIKATIGIGLDKDNAKAVAFNNNSNIFIRVSFRSATLQRLHISEFGKIANAYPQRAKETKTGTLQALGRGNTGVIESTAEGNNDFKVLWDNAVLLYESGQELSPKDFRPVFLSWVDDPDCTLAVPQTMDREAETYLMELEAKIGRQLTQEQRWFWIAQYRELGGEIFQEYPGTPEEAFMASKDGTYYSRSFNEHVVRRGRVVRGLYDDNLPVEIFFDLGSDDYTVMGFVQWSRGEYRIVGEYWNNGYAIGHYIDEAARIANDRGWDIMGLALPHDAKQRSQAAGGSGRAKSVADIAREYLKTSKLSWDVRVLRRASILEGIEAVRRVIPDLWVDASCTYVIDCFLNYSKEYDDKLRTWKKTPLHDEYSHGADMIRQMAMGVIESDTRHDKHNREQRRRTRAGGYDV